jgi:hypothetical protein
MAWCHFPELRELDFAGSNPQALSIFLVWMPW